MRPPTPQVLFVSYSSVLGGAERIMVDWAEAVGGSVLACPPGPLAVAARQRGLEVIALRARRLELRGGPRDRVGAPLRLLAQALELRRMIARLRPACVVAWSMRALLSATAAVAGPGSHPPLLFQHNDLLPSRAVARVVRVAAGRAAEVVALSHAIAADLDPPGRFGGHVIAPGVDLDRFGASPIPDGPPEVVTLGALVDWKRPQLAVDAIALARRELPDLRLRILGEPLDAAGELLRRELRARVEALGLADAVSIDGQTEEAPSALARSTCLLHCADREPFGLVLAEALASGRPVVAPRSAGPLEIVDETCGMLYEPGDPAAAAAAVVDVVRRAQALSGPARTRAEGHFDARISAARFRERVMALAA